MSFSLKVVLLLLKVRMASTTDKTVWNEDFSLSNEQNGSGTRTGSGYTINFSLMIVNMSI